MGKTAAFDALKSLNNTIFCVTIAKRGRDALMTIIIGGG